MKIAEHIEKWWQQKMSIFHVDYRAQIKNMASASIEFDVDYRAHINMTASVSINTQCTI